MPPTCWRCSATPLRDPLYKAPEGTGVILAERASSSRSVIEAFRGLYANFIVQEFIGEAKGADLRCFVVGNRVVAAMRRQAKPGEFRSTCIAAAP